MALQPFSLDDAYGTPAAPAAKPGTGITERPDIMKDFEALRDTHGARITSLVRTKEHNAKVGGKANSQHLRGTAGDFVVPKEKKAAFKADAIARGYQPIDEGDHIHLQLPRGAKQQPVTGSTDGGPKQQVGSGAFSLDDAYGEGAVVDQKQTATSGDYSQTPDQMKDNLLTTAKDIVAPLGKAAKGTLKYIQDRIKTESGNMPIDSMDYKPTQGMPDPFAEFRRITRAKEAAKNAPPEMHGDEFGIAPLFENIMDNSLPAHLVKGFNSIPEAKQLAVLNARKVLQQEEIVKHPDKYPAISVQAAKEAIAARTAKQGKGVGQYWTALKQAAEEHPKKFAGGLFNALTADPEMVLIPGGTGFRAIEGTAKAVKGVEIASKLLKAADHGIDAAITGAGMNTAIAGAGMFAEGKGYDKVELQGAATLGAALGGTLGALFHDGAVAKATDLDAAKLNGTYEQILRDRAKYDVEVEAAARGEVDPRVPTEAQTKINEMLGITSKTDREKFIQQRRKDVKSAFKNDSEFADYQQFKAEERVQRAEQIAKETGARDAHTAAQSAAAADATVAKIPSAEPPSGYSPGEVLRVLKKPGFQRTAEDMVVLRSLKNQKGEIDPKLLARGAAVGVGAAAGFALAPKDHKLAGTIFGGLAGLAIPGGGSVLDRMRQGGAISHEGDIISMLVKDGKMVEPKDAAKIQAEDIKLVEKSKAGDQQAFAKLHKQYYDRLKRAADKFVRDAGPKLGIDGDDIATDTFVKIWQKLDTYNGDSQFYTWAHSIMRNEALQAIRKAANQREGGNVRISSMHTSGSDAGPGSLASGHIVDTESGAIKGSVEEAAADVADTPENAAIRSQVEQQVIKAFKKLPELQRKVLTLSEVELMGSKEIAEQLGIPVKTVDSYISRGRAKVMEDLRNDYSPRSPGGKQAGAADSRVLKAAAIAGLGALAGGSLNTKHRVWGAILGAGLFTVLGRGKNVWKDADHVAGIMSTRIINKSEAVHFRLKSYYKVRAQVTHDLIAAGDPFLTRVNKLKKSTSKLIEHSILTGDAKVTDRLLNAVGDHDLIAGWNVMRTTLRGIGKQLFDLGMIKELNENYFPRMVKDKEGLFKAIGKDQAQKITDLIEKANKESLKKTGSPLTEIQESDIINKIISKQGVKGLSGREGYTHARRFEEIPEELMPFYANLAESYHTYIRTAVKNIELAKFFGKHLVMKEEAGIKFTDIERSIGNYVNADIKSGKLDSNDVTEIHEMIKAMLGSEKGGNKTLQGAKNVLLGSYLGNPLAAATQITSPFIAAHLQGVRPALEAVVRKITGQNIISHKTFGLADHMSEEFVGTTKSAKFLKFVMAKGLFKFGDLFDKDVKLNAAVIKARSMATRETGRAKLAEKFKGQFGPERFEKLLTELKDKKVGPETEMLAYLELSRSDPIDAAEMSEFYAANPNGRTLLMLKSYMLKEFDIVRRDSYNHIKKGGVSNIAKGVAGLASASIAFSLSGMSAKHLKDWMLGRKFHFESNEIVMNMVKTFGWSQYASDKSFGTTTASGKPSKAKSQFFTQIGEMVAPPVPYKQLDQIWNLDPKGVASIPIVGRFLAEHYANEAAKAKAAKAAEVGDD